MGDFKLEIVEGLIGCKRPPECILLVYDSKWCCNIPISFDKFSIVSSETQKPLSDFNVVGKGQSNMDYIFEGSALTPSSETIWQVIHLSTPKVALGSFSI